MVQNDSALSYNNELLTSEYLRQQCNIVAATFGAAPEWIIACGAHGADPHDHGTGQIYANQLIVCDLFPRLNDYYGDMTRTFIKGQPSAA